MHTGNQYKWFLSPFLLSLALFSLHGFHNTEQTNLVVASPFRHFEVTSSRHSVFIRIISYFNIRESVNHCGALWLNTAFTSSGVWTRIFPFKGSFRVSSNTVAVAAITCTQAGHPLATGSSNSERYATGLLHPPSLV